MRKAHRSLRFSLALAASVVLAGCQGGLGGVGGLGGIGGGVSADSRLNSQTEQYEAKFFGSSGVGACITGAAGGAVLGAITGQLQGGSTQSTIRGAAIGAVGGCVAAMGANYYLEKQRVNNASTEAQINSAIKDVKTLNKAIASDIRSARAVINEDKAKLAKLNKQLKGKSTELSAVRAELAKVDANLKQLSKMRASMQKQYDEFMSVSNEHKKSGAKTVSLDKEIAQVKKRISEMDSMIATLNKQRTAIKVG